MVYNIMSNGVILFCLRCVWCRSVTSQLFSDIIEVCVMACNLHVSFYEQRRIQAEDNILNNDNSARSIARLFAKKKTRLFPVPL